MSTKKCLESDYQEGVVLFNEKKKHKPLHLLESLNFLRIYLNFGF